MILDHISNAHKYYCLHNLFEKAFDYLCKTNFSKLAEGKYPISGERCFAIVNRYTTKAVSESFAESHKKYIDIQYVFFGAEEFGYAYIKNLENKEYCGDNDLQKHYGNLNFLSLRKDHFAILFPDDVHMPGVIAEKPGDILKVVVKVAI